MKRQKCEKALIRSADQHHSTSRLLCEKLDARTLTLHSGYRLASFVDGWQKVSTQASSRFRQKGCLHLIGPLVRWVGRFLALSSAVGPDNTTGVRMANAKLLLLLLLHTVLFTLVVRSAYISESWAMLTSDRPSAPKCVEIPRNLTLCYGIQVSLFGYDSKPMHCRN